MGQLRSRYQRPAKRQNLGGKEPWFFDMWRTFGRACAYCRKPLKISAATRDHVLPKSQGGDRRGNIVPACKRCNGSKGNSPVSTWLNAQNFAEPPLETLGRISRITGIDRMIAGGGL